MKYALQTTIIALVFSTLSLSANAALLITNVTAQAATSGPGGTITITGTCDAGAGHVTAQIKPQGSGPSWTLLAAGNGNCNNPGPKTKVINYTQAPGSYKIRILQGSNVYVWPNIVVLP